MFYKSVFLIVFLLTILTELAKTATIPNSTNSVNEYFLQNPRYLHYDELTNLFRQLESDHPKLVKMLSVGRSVKNRELWVLEINKNVQNRTLLTPMFKYVANMHGDESVGRQLMIYLAEYLIYNYGKDERVTKLVDTTDIYLMPSMNPDGFENSKEGVCESLPEYVGRENENSVDLNRDFPDQFNVKQRTGTILAGRQPETVALMTWIISRPFVLSGNLHGGAVVASYPFDDSPKKRNCCKESLSPDNNVFKKLALNYADNNPLMKSGGSCPPEKFEKGITNGAFWYELTGGMQDFNYVHSNCFEVTFELSCCKYPNAKTLPEEWYRNKESLIGFIESSHWGVKGLVSDKQGEPVLDADVVVEGIKHNVTTSNKGEYWRLLLPGRYEIYATAYGFKPSERITINVTEDETIRQDIVLERLAPVKEAEVEVRESPLFDKYGFMIKDDYLFRHHHYDDMVKFLRTFAKMYPKITYLHSIGQSVQGRELYVLVLGSTPDRHVAGKPEFKYVANMHGNEVVGREILLYLVKYLCEHYGSDNRVTTLLNTTRIHLLPSMNPDGYEISREGDAQGLNGRTNAHNVDLNRNFPDQYGVFKTNRVPEPETQLVMDWSLSEPFVLSANLHNGALVANYPFDDTPSGVNKENPSPDDAIFKHLALTYSNAHRTMHEGKPCSLVPGEHFEQGIVNGARWYVLNGGMQDWNYLVAGCMELTLELGCYKYPTADKLSEYWLDNREALLAYMEEVHKGVYGFVTSTIGRPIEGAEIIVEGISHFVKTGKGGDFYRILLPGTYSLTVGARGYESYTSKIVIPESGTLMYNATLLKNDPAHWANAYDFDNLKNQFNPTYHTNSELYKILGDLENRFSSYASFQIESEVSMAIHRLKITDKIENEDETKFNIAIIGNLYGTQPIGREMGIYLARHLLKGAAIGDPSIRDILSKTVIYVVPVIDRAFEQIWGDYPRTAPGNTIPTTSTCNNISADFKQVGDFIINAGSNRFSSNADSKKIAIAFKRMLVEEKFDLVLNIEGGSGDIIYPKLKDDTNVFEKIADVFRKNYKIPLACPEHFPGTYDLSTDYLYSEYDTPMVTFKVTCCLYPPVENVPIIWREILGPFVEVLKMTTTGIHGFVKDEENKIMINSTVSIQGTKRVYEVSKGTGHFKIMLIPGKYVLEIRCHNYENYTQEVVVGREFSNSTFVLKRESSHAVFPQRNYFNSYDDKSMKAPLIVDGTPATGIRGYVMDGDNHPVSYANIFVVEQNSTVKSDESGKYTFPLPIGKYTIEVTAEGYFKNVKYVPVDNLNYYPNIVVFTLTKDPNVLGLPRLIFIMLTGIICLLLIGGGIFLYTVCRDKNDYWLLASNTFEEDFKDYDETKENEIFARPMIRRPIVQPYYDEDDEEEREDNDEIFEQFSRLSSSDDEEIVLLKA